MRSPLVAAVCVAALVSTTAAQDPTFALNQQWPQWRGPLGNGVAPHSDPPIEWGPSRNIRWKVELGGSGHSSPIIWHDRVYVQTVVRSDKKVEPQTSASDTPAELRATMQPPPRDRGPERPPPEGAQRRGGRRQRESRPAPIHVHDFKLLALDRNTGRKIWERTLAEAVPHESGHQTGSHASNSPVTDGEHVYAYFGSRGLYCVDRQGKVVWKRDFGEMQTRNQFGEGSSPALHGDTLVIVWDHEGDDFITALDKRTGQELWRVARDEPTAWSTPVIIEDNGRARVVASATNAIRAYDLRTAELVWQCGGMTLNVIPTPVETDGVLYAASGFRGDALVAIRYRGARGDITGTPAVLWSYDGKGTPYVPSPVLHDGNLYFLSNYRAQLSCVDARSGKAHYSRERVPGLQDVYASLVAAGGRIYIVGRDGQTAVIAPGPELEVLAVNELDDEFDASPAIVGDEIFLRGHKRLYCIAAD